MIKSELLKEVPFNVYIAKPVPPENGEVVFSTEETDWANAPAVIKNGNGYEDCGLKLSLRLTPQKDIRYVSLVHSNPRGYAICL